MRTPRAFFALVVLSFFCLAAAPSATPLSKKPRRFNRPENPVIRVTTVTVNSVKMWQVEVVTGTLELRDLAVLKQGASMPLSEELIVWRMGQIVLVASDGIWVGGRKWPAGTKLFVDEKGRFYPVAGSSPAEKIKKQ